MYWTYILISKYDGRTYVGYTSNIKDRLARHNNGYVKSTKHRRPLEVLHLEWFETVAQAKERESWWKSSSGRKEMKNFFK